MQKNNNNILIVVLSGLFIGLSTGFVYAAPLNETSDSKTSENYADTTANDDNSGKAKAVPNDKNQKDSGEELKSEADAVASEATQIVDKVKTRLKKQAQMAEEKENAVQPGDVRVTYVPETVKNEIKQQLRGELRDQVLHDILEQAKNERWGLPDAQPDWFSRIRFKGDFRLRAQADVFSGSNVNPLENGGSFGYYNFQLINEKGGFGKTDQRDWYYNTWEDRYRLRIRSRLNLTGKVSNTLKTVMRVTTGNTSEPVSTNQTLGQYGNRFGIAMDQAYLQYNGPLTAERQWLKLTGGRMSNPWFSTDLIWDSDLAFDGLAASFDLNMRSEDSLMEMTANDRTFFMTYGVFPLQEQDISTIDKWLMGAQLGTKVVFENQTHFTFGLAYYDFYNVQGRRNNYLSTDNDFTAPRYMQKGNLLFDIRNDTDVNTDLWALAADYNELALTAQLDIASYAPLHITFTGEYVKNIGYNKNDIIRRTNGVVTRSGGFGDSSTQSSPSTIDSDLSGNTVGYQLIIGLGWPKVTLLGNWRASLAYKHLEADAVLDAFTDSDFHLGGTNAKGWIVQYDRCISENAWLTLKYTTAEEIKGLPFQVDVIQMDVNAIF